MPSVGGKDKDVDVAAWTDRLLTTMRFLSEKSIAILISLSGIKSTYALSPFPLPPKLTLMYLSRPNAYDVYLESCIKNNGGVIDNDEEMITKRLKASTAHIAGTFPEPVKASEDLQAFAKLNENRLYKLLGTCIDPQTDIKGLSKAQVSPFLVPSPLTHAQH